MTRSRTVPAKTGLLELAERCEAAEGASFALEQEIWAAAVARPPANLAAVGNIKPPAYTASLDAAMTLVPEGQRVIGMAQGRKGVWHVTLANDNVEAAYASGEAATAALALCAAALRARAAQ